MAFDESMYSLATVRSGSIHCLLNGLRPLIQQELLAVRHDAVVQPSEELDLSLAVSVQGSRDGLVALLAYKVL